MVQYNRIRPYHSPYQIAVADERAAAHVALVILARRMGAYVHRELRLAGECHGAAIAAQRFLGYVRPPAGFNAIQIIAGTNA